MKEVTGDSGKMQRDLFEVSPKLEDLLNRLLVQHPLVHCWGQVHKRILRQICCLRRVSNSHKRTFAPCAQRAAQLVV